MQMYIDAQKEMYGRDVIEYDHGYVLFKRYEDNSIYIHFMYTKPEFRQQSKARMVLNDLKKKFNVSYFTGYVDKTSGPWRNALIAHLKGGYDIVSVNEESIIVSLDASLLEE
jgi:hypothetical protein